MQNRQEFPIPSENVVEDHVQNQIGGSSNNPAVNPNAQVVYSTRILRSVDEGVPDMDSLVSINNANNISESGQIRLIDVHRKTAPPLNLERERRMEELG